MSRGNSWFLSLVESLDDVRLSRFSTGRWRSNNSMNAFLKATILSRMFGGYGNLMGFGHCKASSVCWNFLQRMVNRILAMNQSTIAICFVFSLAFYRPMKRGRKQTWQKQRFSAFPIIKSAYFVSLLLISNNKASTVLIKYSSRLPTTPSL